MHTHISYCHHPHPHHPQGKIKAFADQCDITLDVPEFVKTLHTQEYAPPRDLPFATPQDRTLDPLWSEGKVITSGTEVWCGI